MNHSDQTPTSSPQKPKNRLQTHWLNFRRKRFWALLIILLYTLAGFFLAPVIIEKQILSLLEQDLQRKANIEKVEVNPYVLSLSIQGLELDDKDDVKLASFGEFFANFQLSSIFKRAWTFDEIRLTEPYFLVERFTETDSRIKQLVDDFTASRPAEPEPVQSDEDDAGLPRLLIYKLQLESGHAVLRDNLQNTVVETQLTPINIAIQGLNTLPERDGSQSVTIQLAENASLKWNGSLSLAPFESAGALELEGLHIDPIIAYLKPIMPLESLSATLSSQFDYHVQIAVGGQPEVNITNLLVSPW